MVWGEGAIEDVMGGFRLGWHGHMEYANWVMTCTQLVVVEAAAPVEQAEQYYCVCSHESAHMSLLT